MSTKKRNKNVISRRVRRALNSAELPPTQIGNRKIVSMRWGSGPRPRSVDGMIDPYWYDYETAEYGFTFCFSTDCCDCCDICPHDIYTGDGEGWSFDAANDTDPPTLGDLFAA